MQLFRQQAYVMTVEQQSRQLAVHIYRISDWRQIATAGRAWDADEDGLISELTPDELLSGAITLMEAALRRASVHPGDLVGVGIAASPHAVVAWEAVSGRPYGLWFTPPRWDTLSDDDQAAFLLDGEPDLRARLSGRSADHLRVGGVDSWLLWNLTQGDAFAIDVSHDLAGLCASSVRSLLPVSVWPQPLIGPGPAGRLAQVYLEGARPIVGSLASAPVSALFSTGDERAGTSFIGYRQEGYIVVLGDLPSVSREDQDEPRDRDFGQTSIRMRPATFCARGRGVAIGRFYVSQMVIDWVEHLFYQRDALPDIMVALFGPGPVVTRVHGDHPDRAALIDIDRRTTPAQLYAAALRSLAFCAHEYVLEAESAGRVSESACLYADDSGYGLAALFAYQTAVSRRPLYCDRRSASAFGSALLTAVGAGAISLQAAIDAARDSADRERYDVADPLDHVPSLYDRWRQWSVRG